MAYPWITDDIFNELLVTFSFLTRTRCFDTNCDGNTESDDQYWLDSKSEVVIIDAKAMAADPVAVVSMPTRVPYGFHAFFVTEVDFSHSLPIYPVVSTSWDD